MEVRELALGLWRWTAPHPAWTPDKDKPGGWPQMVGCVSYEPGDAARRAADAALVLIDPLAPPDGTPDADRFWRHLDEDVARVGLPVAILIGNRYHGRSSQTVHDRYREKYGASIWAHEAAAKELACRVTDTFDASRTLPSGVAARVIGNPTPDEVAYFLPAHGALVFSDALIGTAAGEVRVPPASWADPDDASQSRYRDDFRTSLRSLVELPLERLIPSHGEPILSGAREALRKAIDAPAWGET